MFLSVVLAVPFLREVFRFGALSGPDVLVCGGAGLLSIVGFELVKLRKRFCGS